MRRQRRAIYPDELERFIADVLNMVRLSDGRIKEVWNNTPEIAEKLVYSYGNM